MVKDMLDEMSNDKVDLSNSQCVLVLLLKRMTEKILVLKSLQLIFAGNYIPSQFMEVSGLKKFLLKTSGTHHYLIDHPLGLVSSYRECIYNKNGWHTWTLAHVAKRWRPCQQKQSPVYYVAKYQ